jgi:hypothetical protein
MPRRKLDAVDRYVEGIKTAAAFAGEFDGSSTHPYKLEDVILCKLNVTKRKKPRVNDRAVRLADVRREARAEVLRQLSAVVQCAEDGCFGDLYEKCAADCECVICACRAMLAKQGPKRRRT